MAGQEMQESRLLFYQERLADWQGVEGQMAVLAHDLRPMGWYRCLDEARDLHDQYERSRQQVAPDDVALDSVPPDLRAGELLDRDITYMRSGCDAILAIGSAAFSAQPEGMAVASRARSAALPAAPPAAETRQQFALALMQGGQFEMAANVLAGAGNGVSSGSEELAMPRLTADLLLAVGRVTEARGRYEMLGRYSGDLRGVDRWVVEQQEFLRGVDTQSAAFPAFLSVLRAYLLFDGKRVPDDLREGVARLEEQAPASVPARRGRRLLEMVEEKLGDWLPGRLAEVNGLVAAQEFARALAILEGLAARDDLDPARQALVHDALAQAQKAKFLVEEARQAAPEQEAVMQLENGMQLLESRQYDEAIAFFTALLATGHQAEAREKIGQASDLAIKEIRGRASALFVQARQTNTHERKKILLMESRQLLQDALTRYPSATAAMLDKVRQNLVYLEDNIRQVDPTLLEVPLQPGVKELDQSRP
jgi:hypothetical protein